MRSVLLFFFFLLVFSSERSEASHEIIVSLNGSCFAGPREQWISVAEIARESLEGELERTHVPGYHPNNETRKFLLTQMFRIGRLKSRTPRDPADEYANLWQNKDWALICWDPKDANENSLQTMLQQNINDPGLIKSLVKNEISDQEFDRLIFEILSSTFVPPPPLPEYVTANHTYGLDYTDPRVWLKNWRAPESNRFRIENNKIYFGDTAVAESFMRTLWRYVPKMAYGTIEGQFHSDWMTQKNCSKLITPLSWMVYYGIQVNGAESEAWQLDQEAFSDWAKLIYSHGYYSNLVSYAPSSCKAVYALSLSIFHGIEGLPWVSRFDYLEPTGDGTTRQSIQSKIKTKRDETLLTLDGSPSLHAFVKIKKSYGKSESGLRAAQVRESRMSK